MREVIAIVLLAILAAACLGCVTLSEYITPATVSPAAVKFAAEAGVIDANSYRGYANLAKARRLGAAVKAAYEVNVLAMDQMRERHELDYGILNEVATRNIKIGEQREEIGFGETGILPAALGLVGMGGLGGFLGLMRKRPGDMTPADLEKATAQAGINLGDKERQLLEVVQGVEIFLDTYKSTTDNKAAVMVKELKTALKTKTNADTKQVIAALKAV